LVGGNTEAVRAEARSDGPALFLMECFPPVKGCLLPEEQKCFSFKHDLLGKRGAGGGQSFFLLDS